MSLKRLIISLLNNIIQMISIPLLYSLFFNISKIFHQPNNLNSNNFYGLTLLFISYYTIVSIPILSIIELIVKPLNRQVIINLI